MRNVLSSSARWPASDCRSSSAPLSSAVSLSGIPFRGESFVSISRTARSAASTWSAISCSWRRNCSTYSCVRACSSRTCRTCCSSHDNVWPIASACDSLVISAFDSKERFYAPDHVECVDLSQRLLHRLLPRPVSHDHQFGRPCVCVGLLLVYRGNAHVVVAQDTGDLREHARAVTHRDAHIVARLQHVHAQDRYLGLGPPVPPLPPPKHDRMRQVQQV